MIIRLCRYSGNRRSSRFIEDETRSRKDMVTVRKSKITSGLLLFLFIIILLPVTQKPVHGGELPSGIPSDNPVAVKDLKDTQTADHNNHKILVQYFHGTFRCFSCRRIEQLTTIAVEEGFSKEIKNGLVEMKVINVDKPENKHFIKDYQLYTKSVILSDCADGKEVRWKNLQRIWELFRNEKAFVGYIQKELRNYLEGTH
jgi:hypothetical protein